VKILLLKTIHFILIGFSLLFVSQISYAQYNINITKINPSGCYNGGEIVEIEGRGFDKQSTRKTLVILANDKEYSINTIRSWSTEKITVVIPKIDLTNKIMRATLGMRIGSIWASNRYTIMLCSLTNTARTPFNTEVNRELRNKPRTPFSSTLTTRLPETPSAGEQKTTTSNTQNPEIIVTAETASETIKPRGNSSLNGLGTPPKIQLNINPSKKEKTQQEPKEIIVISASMDEALVLADLIKQYNIRIKRRTRYDNLGTVISVLGIPDTENTADIIQQLREYDSALWIDFNHRYQLLEGTVVKTKANPKQWAFRQVSRNAMHETCGKGLRIGVIDTGISSNVTLEHKQIIEKSFIPNGVVAANKDHGTAIGSLLLGSKGSHIIGLTPQITLYSAAIFRQRSNNKSDTTAEFILAALNWLAGENIKVINMSLGGPRNLPIELAITTLSKRGITVVASAGIDKNNKPLYPAAQDEVIAVRATDINKNIFNEKIHGDYIDFSAPGVDLWLLNEKGKGKYVSGSSFAAPFIAASYLLIQKDDHSQSSNRLIQLTEDLGKQDKDPFFGFGFVHLPKSC